MLTDVFGMWHVASELSHFGCTPLHWSLGHGLDLGEAEFRWSGDKITYVINIYIVHSETKGARYGIAQLQIKGLLPNSKTSKTKIADRLFARTAFVNTTFSIPDIGVFAAGWMMPEVYVLTMWSAMRLYDCACLWFMIFMSTIQWPFLSEYWEFTTFFVDIPESSHKNHCAVLMISDGHFRMGFWHFGSHITMDDRLECLRIY
jgi:hypothetical protein